MCREKMSMQEGCVGVKHTHTHTQFRHMHLFREATARMFNSPLTRLKVWLSLYLTKDVAKTTAPATKRKWLWVSKSVLFIFWPLSRLLALVPRHD